MRPTIHAAQHGTSRDKPIEYEDFRGNSPEKKIHLLPELEDLELVFVAFDVLYIRNGSVTKMTLSERHRILRSVVKDAPLEGIPIMGPLKGRLVPLIPDQTFLGGNCLSKIGTSPDDIAEMFSQAILLQVPSISWL